MIPPTGNCYQVQCTTGATALTGGSCFLLACLRMLLLLSGDVELNPGPTTNKELNIKAVMGIFGTFAHHYKTIGDGLEVYIADVIQMQDTPKGKLREIFQRWFDAGKNVNWDTLKNLCDKNSAELGQAKNDIQAYLTSTSGSTSAAESMYREPHGRAAAGQDKELDMAAVMQIFGPSANHFGIIGAGLGVKVDDLMVTPGAADTNLILVFQRWFDADRDVNWKALEKLCDTYSDKLGKAKKKLPNYIGSALGPPAQSIETRPQASAQKKKIDLKEPLDSTAAGQDEAKSDEKESDRPPDVSKFCPILDIIQKKI